MSGDPAVDVQVFADRVLRRPLWPHQLEAARSTSFITAIAAARRTGKTTFIETLAAWTCFRERNVKAVILSAGQEASRRVTEQLAADLAASSLTRGAVVDDFATRIRLSNGSEIVSLPASQRQVRGLGRGVKLLVVDEAGFVADELWRAAHYVALDERGNGARIVLGGTPWGGGFFREAFRAGRDGDVDHAAFHWTHRVNPRLDHAYLERQRDRVSPMEYSAEVLGEWSDEAGALFPRELLDRQTADIELPSLGRLRGPARPGIGVDWGVSFDRSAAAVIHRAPVASLNDGGHDPSRAVFVVSPTVWPVKTPLHDVVEAVAGARAPWAFLAPEVTGVGAMPGQELARRVSARGPDSSGRSRLWAMVATTNPIKTAAYGLVLALLERGQLVLPRDPDLLRQLAGLRIEHRDRGFLRIEAENAATHDDVADALALAMMPRPDPGGVKCLMHTLSRDGVISEAPVPRLDEPIVTTGGGLRVYRRPVLQSVDGLETTLPPGARTIEQEQSDELAQRVRAALNRAAAAAHNAPRGA